MSFKIPAGRDSAAFVRNLARYIKNLDSASNDTAHVYVFEDIGDYILHREDLEIDEHVPTFNTTHALVGYDIETADILDSPTLVSHQFFFSCGPFRFGVVILTTRRFTEKDFLNFLHEILSTGIKCVYVAAHFSVFDGGWLRPSPLTTTSGNKKPSTIPFRDRKWCDRVFVPFADENARPKNRTFYFVDTTGYAYSLRAVGESIGIPKLSHNYIERMDEFRMKFPIEFIAYGIRDSIIAAEAISYFHAEFSRAAKELGVFDTRLPVKPSTPGYSEIIFSRVCTKLYQRAGLDSKQALGFVGMAKCVRWEETCAALDGSDRRFHCTAPAGFKGVSACKGTTVISSDLDDFLPFYYGGRNEVLEVGARGTAVYHDLKSAYPTAFMLIPDYRFDCVTTLFGRDAYDRLIKLFSDGSTIKSAFHIAGVELSWSFRNDAQPIFPVRVSEGLVFPRCGSGCITWPEVYVALLHGLLDSYTVHRFIEFEPLDRIDLGGAFKAMLQKRDSSKADKALYKLLSNSAYGKFAQGVQAKVKEPTFKKGSRPTPPSSISCYPLAAYATGVCRAAMGELLNLNPCYAITTDGFISPLSTLKQGAFNDYIDAQLKGINPEYKWVESDFTATQSLFLRTRGYVLVNDDAIKLKQMGIQVSVYIDDEFDAADEDDTVLFETEADDAPSYAAQLKAVEEFLSTLQIGSQIKKSFPSFADLRARQAKNPRALIVPAVKETTTRVSSVYDFKRIPLICSLEPSTFTVGSVSFETPSFSTYPLESALDFHRLRRRKSYRMNCVDYAAMLELLPEVIR